MREQTIDALSQTLPQLRAQMEQSFAGNAVLKRIRSPHVHAGLFESRCRRRHGRAPGGFVENHHRRRRAGLPRSRERIDRCGIFSGQLAAARHDHTERQEMAERIATRSSSAHCPQGIPAKWRPHAACRAATGGRTMLQQQGIDLTNLRLNAAGIPSLLQVVNSHPRSPSAGKS